MVCSIVQAGTKFVSNGCPNCEEFLEMRHSADVVQDCTSAVFEGMIAMADPQSSWVAKWQRLQGYAPGTYAVKVEGVVSFLPRSVTRQSANNLQLPEDYVAAAENAGVRYHPRDGTAPEELQ
jgi:transcription elongation factor SPT4